MSSVPGWFSAPDIVLFEWILGAQNESAVHGNLVELGAYLGKSACLIGAYLKPGQTFTVVDTFGADLADAANKRENDREYPTLTRQSFEANYLRFHRELPVVVQGLSSEIVRYVQPGSVRFFHIDASHLYDQVRTDIHNALQLCSQHGVVVIDDYRSAHTPGVAAAAWEVVTAGALRPIVVTGTKLYGTPGDPTALQNLVESSIAARREMGLDRQTVAGSPLLLVAASESASRLRSYVPPALVPLATRVRDRLRA